VIVHAITPGDHFSPRTGSAIPTVVHGLATASALEHDPAGKHVVLLDRTTYPDRYPSAEIIEYDGAPYPSRAERVWDALMAQLRLPRQAAARAFRPLRDALAELPAATVVAHNAPVLATLLRDQPHTVILYAHNDILRTATRAELAGLSDVHAIVCVSRDLADRTSSRLPSALARRVHVVDNGVDTQLFFPAATAPSNPVLRVMFIGRIVPEKGPDVLLRAAAALGRDDLEFVLVGSAGFDATAALSTYERSLRALADQVRARVTFLPFTGRAELSGLLRSADVFVAPSRWPEPSGLTLGEAMATGLPIVTTNTGGIPEVVGDAALLTAPDAPLEVANAIAGLADDPALRLRLGERARQRALARDWGRSWRQFAAILDTR